MFIFEFFFIDEYNWYLIVKFLSFILRYGVNFLFYLYCYNSLIVFWTLGFFGVFSIFFSFINIIDFKRFLFMVSFFMRIILWYFLYFNRKGDYYRYEVEIVKGKDKEDDF